MYVTLYITYSIIVANKSVNYSSKGFYSFAYDGDLFTQLFCKESSNVIIKHFETYIYT
jgi:hypothetical protein